MAHSFLFPNSILSLSLSSIPSLPDLQHTISTTPHLNDDHWTNPFLSVALHVCSSILLAMNPIIFLLSLFSIISFSVSQQPQLRGYFIDCGATVKSLIDGQEWMPDAGLVFAGNPKNLSVTVVPSILSTVRSFPNSLGRKFCYVVPTTPRSKYMVRTTYFYGEVNGQNSPPVFDQIVDGTFWSVVNTTEDYANGLSSYYEGIFETKGKTMSICVGSNTYTFSDPFISAIEVVLLGNSLYNTTDFGLFGLSLVARNSFGYNGSLIRYPDDQFNRFWQPYGPHNLAMDINRTVSVSGFWNLPPTKIFETHITSGSLEPLELNWPPASLPNSTYYIALYFSNDQYPSSNNSRVVDISLNGITYYKNLNVITEGLVVFATKWPLDGPTKVTLTPASGSNLGPLINGGEIFDIIALGGRTLTRDVIALERLRSTITNFPVDWHGDPCLPRQYSWTGITCSEGPRIRVVSLNLTSMGLSGSLSPYIANMTALSAILLGNNSLSGSIPNLSSLQRLESLHLEDNLFSGEIPSSLGDLSRLQELFLQNNNLTGQVPSSLLVKPGLDLRITPGNHLSLPPPPQS